MSHSGAVLDFPVYGSMMCGRGLVPREAVDGTGALNEWADKILSEPGYAERASVVDANGMRRGPEVWVLVNVGMQVVEPQ